MNLEGFSITSVSGTIQPAKLAAGDSPLGPLANLVGTWKGTGFNQIWRPVFGHGAQDRFLELNETTEELQFVEIQGDIPNRGLVQADINLRGMTYLQKINDAIVKSGGKPAGLHIEPGIWINIPLTTNPNDPPTVARLANIPHGTSLAAQGTGVPGALPLQIPAVGIKPFPVGQPGNLITFPEQALTNPSQFRTPAGDIPHVTQTMVDNPNSVLQAGIAGKNITSVVVIQVSTAVPAGVPPRPPSTGGGTSNIAFLQGAAGGPNADAVQMDATFWIEEFVDAHGHTKHQLQYSQTVLLNFNTLSWPHVSVATLLKQ